MKWAPISAAFLVLPGTATVAQEVPRVGVYDLQTQRVSGASSVTVKGASYGSEVSVVVTVGVDGKVLDAKVADNLFKLDPRPAVAAAKSWTFRPQVFEGAPIQAVGVIEIRYTPPEIAPDPSVPFPAGAPGDVEITLERSACFGSCPDYRVSISGAGKVRFTTERANFPGTDAEVHREFNGDSVLWPGTHEDTVPPEAVAALVEKFRAAHFMGMKATYQASITDNPTYALTLRLGNQRKRVIDYVGAAVGMPASITTLEDAVDALAGTERWVRGNAGTIALLKARHFDFKSKGAAELVVSAIRLNWSGRRQSNVEALIRAAIAEGLDLTTVVDVGRNGRPERKPIATVIARFAAQSGNEALFDAMARGGVLARMPRHELDAVFAGGMGCSPAIARALVTAGANPKAVGDNGNALHALRGFLSACPDAASERRVAMAQTLIDLGVPLEARDSLGWTPLMACDDPALAALLLKAGADPNAREGDTSVILSIDDDRVALLLLRAGADPKAKDSDGTLRRQAWKYHWPATLAWLDAHGIP